jgi:ABC-type phosphate transport system auxiliary subunit
MDRTSCRHSRSNRITLGSALIALGVILALRTAGIITWVGMSYLWPIALIFFGLRIVLRQTYDRSVTVE